MYDIEELKYDFANKIDTTICQACLSSDRKLSSLGEYVDIFINISNISFNMIPEPVLLCWECIAFLKKIKLFKAKVEQAQRLCYQFVNKQNTLLKTLSKLTKTNIENIITISHNDEDNDIKEKLAIKQENDSNGEYDDQNVDDHCRDQIKKENITPSQCVKKNKTLHYRILYESNAKKVARKKFRIKPDEAKVWMDKEKNSDFYRNYRYKCMLCVRGFHFEKKLEKHMLKHDESQGPYICSICTMHFTTDTTLSSHMRVHKYAWECARCGFQCYTARRLKAHINTHSAVQCAYCDEKFEDVASFYSHYKALHTVFLCDHCGKRCKTKYLLEKHMNHHNETHKCSVCSRRYKSLSALRKHRAAAHVQDRVYCVVCDKHYRNRRVYTRHVQSSVAHAHERDAQEIKKFPCPECGKTYSRRVYMMNHYRHVHTNQSKYYCSQCDRNFLNRTRFVEHMRYRHEGVKKEKNKLCNVCGKGFAANRTLTNHMRTHSGERPYECSYCAAKFTQRTSMLSHVRYIHMNTKRRAH